MSTCRVVFAKGKQKEFLMHAKQLSRLNWERFASDIGVSSYNVLRTTYLNERNTLPITVFRKAAPLFDHTTWSNSIVGFRHAHWGQVMGGSISLKKWHAAMRKKPKSYHDLQSGRFLKARSYNYETSCGYEVRSLYELLVAENLIANGVSHDYEPALHCGNHTLFPDFLADTGFGRVLIELSGFRAPQTWIRLLEKLKLYLLCKAADRILVVHLEQDRETALKITRQLSSLIRTISISDMRRLLRSVASSKDPSGNIRIVSLGEALQVCRRMNGKRFHWYQLIQTLPKDQWVDILVRRGFSRTEIEKVRVISDLKKRLIEAIRLADSHQIVPREAMIEMMAGAYQSSVCHHFGSMNNLALAADMEAGKSLARVHGHSISCGPVAQPDPEMRILKR